MAKKKRSTDANIRALEVVNIAVGDTPDPLKELDPLKAAAALLGKKGGLKGGKARAASLSAKARAEIAKKAAKARWSKPANKG